MGLPDLSDAKHVVTMPYPRVRDVLHQGSCPCGWKIGYDTRTHDAAVDLAVDHIGRGIAGALDDA